MNNSKLTCKFLKLTGIKNLDEVKSKILKKSYSDPLILSTKEKKLLDSMSDDEKNFYFTWDEILEPEPLELHTLEKDFSFDYIIATAKIEYSKRRKRDSIGNVLPKADRVNFTHVGTYFISCNNAVFLIICTSNEVHQGRVKRLVGTSFIDKFNNDYQIPSDLFNWLFYQYVEKNGDLGSDLQLININGFVGNAIDEHNIFKGISDQTSELIITKAFISNGGILKTITARLKNADLDVSFTVDHASNTQIYLNQSLVLKLLEPTGKQNFIVVYLYSYLLPLLKSLYNESAQYFLSNEKDEFSCKIGLEVIKSIADKNSLSREEIIELLDNKSSDQDDGEDYDSTVNL